MHPLLRRGLAGPFAAVAFAILSAPGLAAWDNHALLNYAAFRDAPLAAEKVTAETLDSFLAADPRAVAAALDRAESRASSLLRPFHPRPASLAFDPGAKGPALRDSFLRALRANPEMSLPLFTQPAPGSPASGRPGLLPEDVSLVGISLAAGRLEALAPGESVSSLEVLASASDEPDYGLDVGLFTNNGTSWGREYGFGEQPFGNPALSYGSQAPFHMAFPAESGLIKLAAPFSRKGQVAYRQIQYEELSRLAFSTGHAYWGLRFAGWAIHYIQDMCQPWHARMIPGRGALSIVAINVFGSPARKAGELVLLSNRHLLVEAFAYGALTATDSSGARAALDLALSGASASAPPPSPWRELRIYDATAAAAYAAGPSLDALVAASLPARYARDPSYDYGKAKDEGLETYEPWRDLLAADPAAAASLVQALAPLLAAAGADSRDFLAAVSTGSPTLPRAGKASR